MARDSSSDWQLEPVPPAPGNLQRLAPGKRSSTQPTPKQAGRAHRRHLPHWLSTLPLLARGLKEASNSASMRCKSDWVLGTSRAGRSGRRRQGQAHCPDADRSHVNHPTHSPTASTDPPLCLCPLLPPGPSIPADLDVCHKEGKLGLELFQAVRHHSPLVRLPPRHQVDLALHVGAHLWGVAFLVQQEGGRHDHATRSWDRRLPQE